MIDPQRLTIHIPADATLALQQGRSPARPVLDKDACGTSDRISLSNQAVQLSEQSREEAPSPARYPLVAVRQATPTEESPSIRQTVRRVYGMPFECPAGPQRPGSRLHVIA